MKLGETMRWEAADKIADFKRNPELVLKTIQCALFRRCQMEGAKATAFEVKTEFAHEGVFSVEMTTEKTADFHSLAQFMDKLRQTITVEFVRHGLRKVEAA